MTKTKKAELAMQSIFYIMMAAFFVAILIFGYVKLSDVKGSLSDIELLEIKQDLEASYEFCNDPLNKGSFKTFEIENQQINGMCIFSTDLNYINDHLTDIQGLDDLITTSQIGEQIENEFAAIIEGGDNIILFKADFTKDSDSYSLQKIMVLDSLDVRTKDKKMECFFDLENTGILQIKITC